MEVLKQDTATAKSNTRSNSATPNNFSKQKVGDLPKASQESRASTRCATVRPSISTRRRARQPRQCTRQLPRDFHPLVFPKNQQNTRCWVHLAARRPLGTFTRLIFPKNQQNTRCWVHLAARRPLTCLKTSQGVASPQAFIPRCEIPSALLASVIKHRHPATAMDSHSRSNPG